MLVKISNIRSWSRASLIRLVLFLGLIGLATLTVYRLYHGQPQYQVQVFATPTGWGYDILNNGKLFIHQPTIPGQSGIVGFASQEQARRVGERMARKLQETKALPTLTNDELRQLGVKIP
jgi:hypothetical protein